MALMVAFKDHITDIGFLSISDAQPMIFGEGLDLSTLLKHA